MKLWSENFAGNLHETAHTLNLMKISDVVAMDCCGRNTVVVYRVSEAEYKKLMDKRQQRIAMALDIAEGVGNGSAT